MAQQTGDNAAARREGGVGSEKVLFTPEMVTVFVEHEKVICKLLKKCHGLTMTEFCILRELYLAGGQADGMDFARFLMLKRSSISMAISSLDKKGYVRKAPKKGDRRTVVVSETDAGVEVTREATRGIYEIQNATFWRNLTIAEERGGNRAAYHVLERLRGGPCASAALSDVNTPISPEFIMFVKAVPAQWTRLIRERSGLTLSDYRVLHEVAAAPEGTRAADVARQLLLDRSLVSTVKDKLAQDGLVGETPDEADRRNTLLRATPEGRRVDDELTCALADLTADLYSLCDDELIRGVNKWHVDMHANINVLNRLI